MQTEGDTGAGAAIGSLLPCVAHVGARLARVAHVGARVALLHCFLLYVTAFRFLNVRPLNESKDLQRNSSQETAKNGLETLKGLFNSGLLTDEVLDT